MAIRVTEADKTADQKNRQTLRSLRRSDPKAYSKMMREIKGELRSDREKRRGNVIVAGLKGTAVIALTAVAGFAVVKGITYGAAQAAMFAQTAGYMGSPAAGHIAAGSLFGAASGVLGGIVGKFGLDDVRKAEQSNRAIRATQVAAAKKRGLVPGI